MTAQPTAREALAQLAAHFDELRTATGLPWGSAARETREFAATLLADAEVTAP